ncbi:YybH family protein [Actinosynnema sp. CA-248983]
MRDADEAAISHHIDKIIKGIESKDLESLRRLYSPDVVSFDVEPPLQHVGIEAKLKNWTNAFKLFENISYEVRNLTLTVDQSVAFAHGFGRLSGTTKTGTTIPGMWVRATFGFQKFNETWLITHDQVSIPFDITTGKSATTLEP